MRYLITGIAGYGKSTLATALTAAGHAVVDADDSAYSHFVERATGKCFPSWPRTVRRRRKLERLWNWLERRSGKSFRATARDEGWAHRLDWVWKEEAMVDLLEQQRDHDLFICGMAHNQAAFYRWFDRIFLLSIDQATIRHRLTTRTNNPFGKRPGEMELTLGRFAEFEALVTDAGGIVIDAARAPDEVMQEILHHAHAHRHNH